MRKCGINGRRALRMAFLFGAAMAASCAEAEDHFLAIGGGYDASTNPASLEADVAFASQSIAAAARGRKLEIYFADGDDPSRDVQYADPAAVREAPPTIRVMAELFGDPQGVGLRYRDHELQGVAGPSDFDVLERRFRELGRELKSGDRLFIIAAGHGGEAYDRSAEAEPDEPEEIAEDASAAAEEPDADDDKSPAFNQYDTSLYLWNRDEVAASELSRWLDRLPRDVEVVLVMGQCYSGGFSHIIFHGADPSLGLSPAARCGFFSQLHDRAASGCTPQPGEVREYSSYFWAALQGKSKRSGEAAIHADYDGDGRTSLAEAHAYAVINSDEIDVPVRTSQTFLRAYSRLGGPFELYDGAIEAAPTAGASVDVDRQKLLEPQGPLAALAKLARPDQVAILERLPKRIDSAPLNTVEDVRVELSRTLEVLADATDAHDAATAATDEALIVAQDEVYERWPELYFAYSTAAVELLADSGADFARSVKQRGSYAALLAAREREERVAAEFESAEAAAAKLERLLRTIEDVVLAANLHQTASPELVERYRQLVELEEQSLR
jgi:hypothetical protein